MLGISDGGESAALKAVKDVPCIRAGSISLNHKLIAVYADQRPIPCWIMTVFQYDRSAMNDPIESIEDYGPAYKGRLSGSLSRLIMF